MAETLRLLIADDHAIVREGLHALISTEPTMEIVGEASDGREAIRLARELTPDVILLDLIMEPVGGIEAIEQIKRENPDARILALTSFGQDDIVFHCDQGGRAGLSAQRFVARRSDPGDL